MKKTGFTIGLMAMVTVLIVFFLITQKDKIWILWFPPLEPKALIPQIEAPISFTSTFSEIIPDKIQKIQEIASFQLPKPGGNVIAISENPSRNSILTIGEHGTFVQWQFDAQKISRDYNFYSAYSGSTYFSRDGLRLIAGGGIVWDTTNGKPINCGIDCEGDDLSFLYEDAVSLLDPSGELIITRGNIHIAGVDNNKLDRHIYYLHDDCLSRETDTNIPRVEYIAIDPSDTYMAYILANGVICVRELNIYVGYDVRTGKDLEKDQSQGQLRYIFPSDGSEIKDLQFDPTGQWLATLSKDHLVVWNLQNFMFPLQLNTTIKNGSVISFDRSGTLLALGTADGIVIYDIKSKKQMSELQAGQVTALYFSRDNRLLIWGDTAGSVHLWGIPKQ